MVQENEIEIKEVLPMLRFSRFKPEVQAEDALKGHSTAIQIRCRQFARLNVFGICR
jgi:hypothetical protein